MEMEEEVVILEQISVSRQPQTKIPQDALSFSSANESTNRDDGGEDDDDMMRILNDTVKNRQQTTKKTQGDRGLDRRGVKRVWQDFEVEDDDDIQILEEFHIDSNSDSSDEGHETDSLTDSSSDGSDSDESSDGNSNSNGKLSSSTSSSEESNEENRNSLGRKLEGLLIRTPPPSENDIEDQESEIIIPLDEEDDLDSSKIHLNEHGQMQCRICSIVFRNRVRFHVHQRRHFAADHFVCPTCLKGFIKFSQCQAHELKEHHQNSENTGFALRSRNGNSTINENCVESGDDLLSSYIVTSTSLYPYRGPPVTGCYAPYEIELKYSRSERKSHSIITSKYTLDCQRKRKREADVIPPKPPALVAPKISRGGTQRIGRAQSSLVDNCEDVKSSDDQLESNKVDKDYVPNCPVQKKNFVKTKVYFCAICAYKGGSHEYSIQQHRRLNHPELPLADVVKSVKFTHYYLDSAETKPTKLKANKSAKVQNIKNKRSTRVRAEVENVKTKAKKLERLKVHRRVWEKVRKPPKKIEFMSAVGLSAKTDVVIGPREGTSGVSSSLYRKRKGRRQRSPSPRAYVVMNKMSNSRNKHFRTCPSCDFFAPSKSDIRKHRSEAHLGKSAATTKSSRTKSNKPSASLPWKSSYSALTSTSTATSSSIQSKV